MLNNNKFEIVILSENNSKVSKLRDLLSKYYTLNISKICDNAASAIEYLNHSIPTILFLDMSFTNILQDVKKPPFVVGLCDTVYTKRIKQFLKMGFFEIFYAPYDEGELNSIMGKILNIYCSYNKAALSMPQYVAEDEGSYENGTAMDVSRSLFIMGTRNEESTRVVFDDVMYLSKVGNYVCVNFIDKTKKYFRSNLKMFQKKFPSSQFIKINRSTVVNIDKVTKVFKNKVHINDESEFEISRSFRKEFRSVLEK